MNDGIIIINKPKDFTSRDVVNVAGKKLGTKKVGHCGTLDPLATGVLILCVGNATKLVPYITDNNKVYRASMILGRQTTTGDLDGEDVQNEAFDCSDELISKVFEQFPKSYVQEVPIYSAVKINGKKLYEYAREGIEVELPSRNVEINMLELINIERKNGIVEITFECEVSKGTYIRSLCLDIAKQLGSVAVMSNLIRTRQGMYKLEEAQDLDSEFKVISTNDLVLPYDDLVLNDFQYNEIRYGRPIENCNSFDGVVTLYYNGELLAIYESDGEMLKSKRGIKVWN